MIAGGVALEPAWVATVVTAALGYLVGSVPVAGIVARRRAGVDLRRVGDRNPGYWNAKAVLGRRAALTVFAGDAVKGAMGAGVGVVLGGPWWVGYVGAGAAMVGHAWPVFAGFRGGRSILCFAGAMCVLSPLAAVIAIAAVVLVSAVTRSFAIGARVGVFGFPVVQAFLEPRSHVAATGVLMSLIGLRFLQAARADRRSVPPG